ncbi:hypothetical protein [Streptomyces sp. NPDC001068]|uniref:hypothetical protein n=1 Tax=Streptomyces sp. NPDC001068 TaxID=3364544 RepID=UPI0036A1E6E9
MTEARTGKGRQSMSGDIYPGDEAMPGREERTAEGTTDREGTPARGAATGREDIAAKRADDREEAPGQAVLVAGDGPGHTPDATRADRPARTDDRGIGTDDRGIGTDDRAAAAGGFAAGDDRPAADGGRTAVNTGRPAAGDGEQAVNGGRLMPNEECGQLERRLQHAVNGFVDEPRAAVEEADRALEELSARLTDAVDRRRRTLRGSWQEADRDHPGTADTEQLRLALRDYRELADRLLHI